MIWWAENSKEAYSYGLESPCEWFVNWSKSRRGDRRGRRVGFPKFKAKDKATPRFAYTAGGFGLIDGDPKALKLPRIGRVHCMEDVAARGRRESSAYDHFAAGGSLVRVPHRRTS